MSDTRLLTTSQVAARLHMSARRVRDLIEAGEIPARRYGRSGWWRVSADTVERLKREAEARAR